MQSRDFVSKRDIAEMFGISATTVSERLKEIRAEKRYSPKDMAVIDDGQIVRVNRLVFSDYMYNRRSLRDKNLRKYVEPYAAEKVALAIGGVNRT